MINSPPIISTNDYNTLGSTTFPKLEKGDCSLTHIIDIETIYPYLSHI